ncbi:MAG: cyclase [Lentisphaerae bacterium]|nr:cyclase [Lentisphaerota bacterium]MCP4099962.1 cyclase [Lentisphaerota bacterium]
MLIDLSIKISRFAHKEALGNEKMVSFGHLGTHFDVMDKEFPLEYLKRNGVVLDVSNIEGRDIEVDDIDLSKVSKDMFVAFYTGFAEQEEYGTKSYFKNHPQLSDELIDELLSKKISIIGIDCAGIRRGKEHPPKDQYCSDKGVFVVENLCNLNEILKGKSVNFFTANTYPVNFSGLTGLPCRVVGEI